MLAKDRTNLKIEEIRMHKHHEIHRVKPLMPALCRIRQGKKVINWETHSLTVDNNQIILFPCGYEFYIANYPEAGLYLAEMLYYPIDLIEKFQNLYAITEQIRNTTGFCLPQNPELIYCWEQLKTSISRGFCFFTANLLPHPFPRSFWRQYQWAAVMNVYQTLVCCSSDN